MAEIETLSESAIVVLVGLRDATARRREPTAACPSGHHTMFTITDLVSDGLMLGGEVGNLRGIADLDRTARGLHKRRLASKRTLHTRSYYGLTDEGLALVARIEEEADVTGLVAAEHARDEAAADLADAQRRVAAAQEALTAARKARGARYPLEALLGYRREYPLTKRGEGNA
jgi:hypothetical protein